MMEQLNTFLQSNQELMLGLGIAAVIGFVIYKKLDERALGNNKRKEIGERIFPDLMYYIVDNGKKANKPFYHSFDKGNIRNIWHTSVKMEDMKKMQDEDEDEDEEEEWKDVTAILVAPERGGLLSLKDKLFKANDYYKEGNDRDYSKIYVFPTDWISQDNYDWLKVDGSVDFRRYAGVYYAIGDEGQSFKLVEDIDHSKRAEKLQNQFHVYAEKMSEADPNKAHEINRTKEESKAEQKGQYDNFNG